MTGSLQMRGIAAAAGWLLDRPSGRELILVGDNGAAGFLVVAYPH